MLMWTKTAHTRVDDLPIGSKVAVWRSQLRGRSTKKKSGYVLGRLVANRQGGQSPAEASCRF